MSFSLRSSIIAVLFAFFYDPAMGQSTGDNHVLSSQLARSRYAESLFNQLQSIDGIEQTSSVPSFSSDGYYYLDYGNTRFGVKEDGMDPGFYRSIDNGPWELVGSFKDSSSPHLTVIGRLDKNLAKFISADAVLQSSIVSVNGPILVSKRYRSLSKGEKQTLLEAYNNGFPIAAIEPSISDVRGLKKLLGLEGAGSNPTTTRYNLVGVYKTNGNISDLKMFKDALPRPRARTAHAIAMKDDYSLEASIFFRWVRSSQNIQRLSAQSSISASKSSSFLNMNDVLGGDVNESTFRWWDSLFFIQTYFSTAYDIKNNMFYIFGKQIGRMSSGYGISSRTITPGTSYGPLAGVYEFANRIHGATLIEDSPETTEGKTTVISGISWNTGGEFNLANGGPVILGGVQVQSMENYEIPDITTINKSRGDENHITYDIAWPNGDRIPIVSYSTWTAKNQFLYKVKNNNRPINIDMYLACQFYWWDWTFLSGWHARKHDGMDTKHCYTSNNGWAYDSHTIRKP